MAGYLKNYFILFSLFSTSFFCDVDKFFISSEKVFFMAGYLKNYFILFSLFSTSFFCDVDKF
ncbi:hypothetical protein VS873_24095, partial [Salmonella enterica subsp. enterica serovar Typhi]|nr:hypothetical protein [Salmonella enterica subsp. enterica serovar Typhi]